MAARLAEQGVALYYHNHHIEFAKYDANTSWTSSGRVRH